jgi:hypothetical protein
MPSEDGKPTMPDVLYAVVARSAARQPWRRSKTLSASIDYVLCVGPVAVSPWLATDAVRECPATPSFGLLRKLETLTHFVAPSARALGRDPSEPPLSRPVARLQALAHRMHRAFLFVVTAGVAVSIVIFLRILLTAHHVPRWQEELAKFLPFLD